MAAEALNPNLAETKTQEMSYNAPGVEGFERHDNILLLNEGKFADYIKEVITLKQNPEKMAALYEKIKKIDTSISLTAHEKKLKLRAIPCAEMLATVAEKIVSDPDGKGITIQLNFRELVFSRRWAIGAGDLLPVVVKKVTFRRRKSVVGTRHGRKFLDKNGKYLSTKGGPRGGLYLHIRPSDITMGKKATKEAEAAATRIKEAEEATKRAAEEARALMPEVIPTPITPTPIEVTSPTPTPTPTLTPEFKEEPKPTPTPIPAPTEKPEEVEDDATEDVEDEKKGVPYDLLDEEVPPVVTVKPSEGTSILPEDRETLPEAKPKEVALFGDSQGVNLGMAGKKLGMQFEGHYKVAASINYVKGMIEKNLLPYLIAHPSAKLVYIQTGGNDVGNENGKQIFDRMMSLVTVANGEIKKANEIVDAKNKLVSKRNKQISELNITLPDNEKIPLKPLMPRIKPQIVIGNLWPKNKDPQKPLEGKGCAHARLDYNERLKQYLERKHAEDPNYKDEYKIFDARSIVANENGFQRTEFQRKSSKDWHLGPRGYRVIHQEFCRQFNVKTDKSAPIQVATLPEAKKDAEPKQNN